jgi:hypothetical protein
MMSNQNTCSVSDEQLHILEWECSGIMVSWPLLFVHSRLLCRFLPYLECTA